MCQQTLFRDKLIPRRGFYVLYYSYAFKEWEREVYVGEITRHGSRRRSYFCVLHNYRDKPFRSALSGKVVGHDMFIYAWNSSVDSYAPTGWRTMTTTERTEFKKKLWQFDRKE